jgi:hypothetical protein
VNGFLRRLLNLDLLQDVTGIARSQQTIIKEQTRFIEIQQREIVRLKLEYTRWGRDVVENFLIALDSPEDEEELRRHLSEALCDLSDEVARIEEHAPV